MPHKCDTPHGGGVTRNQVGAWLRNRPTPQDSGPQGLPSLIEIHLGFAYLHQLRDGGADD